MTTTATEAEVDILTLFKCKMVKEVQYDDESEKERVFHRPAHFPQVQIYNNFMTGWWRCLGQKEGQYPKKYFPMINGLFGQEPNTIEICSRYIQVDDKDTAFTVDLDPEGKLNPSLRTDAQTLAGVPSLKYFRVRIDTPYNKDAALRMYKTHMPDIARVLKSASRVLRIGGLIFMLLGQEGGNHQFCKPYGLQRIGIMTISVVPNQELRFLNIYVKRSHPDILEQGDFAGQGTLGF